MLKSALGIAVSFFAVFSLLIPGSGAYAAEAGQQRAASGNAAKSASPKQQVKKKAVRNKKAVARNKAKPKRVARTVKRSTVASRKAAAPPKKSEIARAPVQAVAPILTAGDQAGLHLTRDPLALKSNVALVVDQATGAVLFEKNADIALPIASLTKLMTSLVVVEAKQNLDEVLEITADDIDREKNSASRLRVGTRMTRNEMLHLALMSSENRAASALGRHYPGGLQAFVARMNARAKMLGMRDTRFVDPTGLSSGNVASAQDLAKLTAAAYRYPLIREYSTHPQHAVQASGHHLQYMNSNRLVRNPRWDIGLQKTGYIAEAGRCLVMQTRIEDREVVMVFLDSKGKESRLGDAARIRKWLEMSPQQTMTQTAAHTS